MKKTILFIVILSGFLLSVNSCTTAHHCAAYSQIDNGTNTNVIQGNIVDEEI